MSAHGQETAQHALDVPAVLRKISFEVSINYEMLIYTAILQ